MLNFVENAFSGTVFQQKVDIGEFLNLFCPFSLLSVCVRIRPDEFGRVSVVFCVQRVDLEPLVEWPEL